MFDYFNIFLLSKSAFMLPWTLKLIQGLLIILFVPIWLPDVLNSYMQSYSYERNPATLCFTTLQALCGQGDYLIQVAISNSINMPLVKVPDIPVT